MRRVQAELAAQTGTLREVDGSKKTLDKVNLELEGNEVSSEREKVVTVTEIIEEGGNPPELKRQRTEKESRREMWKEAPAKEERGKI